MRCMILDCRQKCLRHNHFHMVGNSFTLNKRLVIVVVVVVVVVSMVIVVE
jgi:hypothetical protein